MSRVYWVVVFVCVNSVELSRRLADQHPGAHQQARQETRNGDLHPVPLWPTTPHRPLSLTLPLCVCVCVWLVMFFSRHYERHGLHDMKIHTEGDVWPYDTVRVWATTTHTHTHTQRERERGGKQCLCVV